MRALRREWAQFRSNLERFPSARLPSAGDIERSWSNLQSAATHTRRSVFQVSAAMGASALAAVPESVQWLSRSAVVAARASGMVVGEAFLKHYASASKEISRTGFSTYWAAHTRPYLVGVIRNFLPQNQSWTERLLSIQPQNPGKIKSVLPR